MADKLAFALFPFPSLDEIVAGALVPDVAALYAVEGNKAPEAGALADFLDDADTLFERQRINPWCLFLEYYRHQENIAGCNLLQTKRLQNMAERVGFEPTTQLLAVQLLSRQPCSTTPAPLRMEPLSDPSGGTGSVLPARKMILAPFPPWCKAEWGASSVGLSKECTSIPKIHSLQLGGNGPSRDPGR